MKSGGCLRCGARCAGKADPSGERRLRDDSFLLVAGFESDRLGLPRPSQRQIRPPETAKAGGRYSFKSNSEASGCPVR